MLHFRVYFRTWKILRTLYGKKIFVNRLSSDLTIYYSHSVRHQSKKDNLKNPWIVAQVASSTITGNPYNLQLTKTDCEEIMRSKLNSRSFQVRDFNLRYFFEMMGFHGNYAGLEINCVVEDKTTDYRFFVKTVANNPVIKEMYWDVHQQPYKEFVFLTKIHKELQNFVQKQITAEFHWGRLEEVMVLDDCCSMGYSAMNREYLDMHHAQAGVCALANLHAASIIYKTKTGNSIHEEYQDISYESLLNEHPDKPKKFLLFSVDAGVRQIGSTYFTDVIPEKTQDAFFSKIRQKTFEMIQNHPKKFTKVCCQGDPTKSNMLFKYRTDGVATDCILVDFGVLRFAPPAMELMQFLHLNSTNDFRTTNYLRLKNDYYVRLSEICAQNGADVSQILSRDQFDESCAFYDEWGTCVRVYYEYVIRLPAEQLFKVATCIDTFLNLMAFGSAELGLEAFSKDEPYRKSVTEAMESAMRFYGYIE